MNRDGRANRMLAICAGLGMFLGALDIAVNVGLPAMTKGLNTDLQTIQWVIVVFVAARAGLVMGAGSFADRFGLRRVYLFGVATYLAAMVAISLSPTLAPVLVFRVLQALGTGCLFAVSPALASRVFPAHRHGLAMGFTTGSQALGMLTGTLGPAGVDIRLASGVFRPDPISIISRGIGLQIPSWRWVAARAGGVREARRSRAAF